MPLCPEREQRVRHSTTFRRLSETIPVGWRPSPPKISGGGGIPSRSAALLLALLAAVLAAAWLIRPAAAQTSTIAVEFTRVAADTRIEGDRIVQGRLSRPNDLIITGAATVKISAETGLTPPLALADLNATNATLSNFQTLTATEVWTVDVTPTANGTVTVSVPHGVTGGTYDSAIRNAAGSLSMTAELGPPKVIWADFTSPGAHLFNAGPYSAGDPIDLTLIFSENVTVSGAPTVRVRTAARPVRLYDAVYHSGSGSSVLVFRHTVPAGGYGAGVTTIESTSITLPSGASIVDTAGTAASLALPPLIEHVERLIPASGEATGKVGDQHEWVTRFSEPVTVSQAAGAEPAYLRILVDMQDGDPLTVRANYVGGSGSRELTFRYTVLAEDNVALTSAFGLKNYRLFIPDGSGVRSAAGVDAYTRIPRSFNTTIRREGEQFERGVSLTAAFTEDVTVRLTSSDPARMSVNPDAFTFASVSVDPQDWQRRRTFTVTLHPDADSEDNSVAILYRFESILAHVDGAGGTFYRVRILDDDRAQTHPADLKLDLSLVDDSDNVVPVGNELTVAAALTYTGGYVPFRIAAGALRVAGNFDWETNGRQRIAIDRQSTLEVGADAACKSATLDGLTTWTCALGTEDSAIRIPPGTPEGVFTISGEVEIDGVTYRGSLDVTIADVDEAASATLDFATDIAPGDSTDTSTDNRSADDRPYPNRIAAGESTRLRLAILNENDAASAAGALDSVLLTTTAGSLSLASPDGECQGGGSACGVPIDLLNAENSDRILIDLAHPGTAGAAVVRATVIANDGESFTPDPLTITLLGPAETLAISEPTDSLLHTATDADDDRDVLKLTISATDAAGNSVNVPYRAPRAIVRDPDGKVVTSGISVVWTEDGDDSDDAHDRFTRNTADAVEATIRVTAAAAAPLKLGVYTLELRTAGRTATREFTVAGEADSITLSEPTGKLRVDSIISFTAALRDAEGNPVPDGTPVAWAERSTSQFAVLVRLAANPVTTDGAASATFLAVGAGTTVVSAESGGVREVALLSIAPAPPAGTADGREPQLRESLSNQGGRGIAAWLGEAETSASALLDALNGIASIRLWTSDSWLRYSRGADDFTINPGAILWLSP